MGLVPAALQSLEAKSLSTELPQSQKGSRMWRQPHSSLWNLSCCY